jgi:hypothetical protein
MKAFLGVTLLTKPDQKGIVRVPAWILVCHGVAVIAFGRNCTHILHVVQIEQTVEWRGDKAGIPMAVLTVKRLGSKVAGIVDRDRLPIEMTE